MNPQYFYLQDDEAGGCAPPPDIDIDSSDEELEKYIDAMREEFRSAWESYIQDFG